MGKLTEKLRQISQGSEGALGFLARGRGQGSAPRPAAVLVTLRATDTASAEAVAKAGVDAVIITGWKPGVEVSAVKTALESGGALWGVEYAGGEDEEVAAAAEKAGAGFLVLGPDAPAIALYEQVEKFDRVLTLSAPRDEMDMLTLRMTNALPAVAALMALPVGMRDLPRQSAMGFARLAILGESLRFPLLALVDETPDAKASRALVRLGMDGVVLTGVGVGAEALAQSVKTVRADLEKIPPQSDREGVSLGGLMGNLGASLAQPAKEPEKEPDEE